MLKYTVFMWGTTHDALIHVVALHFPHICGGKVDLMDNEDAQGRTSEREGVVLMLAGTWKR